MATLLRSQRRKQLSGRKRKRFAEHGHQRSSWSIRNPIPSVLLFILLTLAGLMSFRAMNVQNFPDIELPTSLLTLRYRERLQLSLKLSRAQDRKLDCHLQAVKHIYTKCRTAWS